MTGGEGRKEKAGPSRRGGLGMTINKKSGVEGEERTRRREGRNVLCPYKDNRGSGVEAEERKRGREGRNPDQVGTSSLRPNDGKSGVEPPHSKNQASRGGLM